MPILTVIAGPNGSGKSTLARFVDFDGRERLLDPDAIAVRLNPPNPFAAAVASAKQALNRRASISVKARVSPSRRPYPAGAE